MSCTFRLRTTRPDGSKGDIPLDDVLDESDKFKDVEDGLKSDEIWNEVERVVEQVVIGDEPNTVTIDRMQSVTFQLEDGTGTGKTMQLVFDNPPEGTV